MKRSLLSIAAATALCAPIACLAAEPVYGVWLREGHATDKLEFYDCSGKLCARGVLPMLDGSPPPIVLRSAAKTGPNSWKGDLFNPEDGKTYTGKITYEAPDQLTLTGCLVAFLCQSENWTRISGPPKPKAEAKPDAKAEAKSSEANKSSETKADAKADDKNHDKAQDKGQDKGRAADAKGGGDKPAAATKPATGAETAAKPAKPADAKAAAPKPAASKPAAPKPAPAHQKTPEAE